MRVIAGRLRGRRIPSPEGRDIRPTSDRVRESIFNAVASRIDLTDATVVDLFAGTGALGIEAWSRGAGAVSFVENDRRGAARLRRTLADLGVAGAEVICRDALAWTRDAQEADVVFADPPYAFDDWATLLGSTRAGFFVAESDREVSAPGWTTVRAARYGGTVVTMLSPDERAGSGVPDLQAVALAAGARGRSMVRVLYPGSFDPLHNGHLEIIESAAKLFSSVVVAAVRNPQKGASLFPLEERKQMIKESTAHLDNVEVTQFSSLVVDLAKEVGAAFIVKGLRGLTDFEAELMMAQMNQAVSGIQTVFVPSTSDASYIASKFIREITQYGGDVTSMVPEPVAVRLRALLDGTR